MIAWFEAGHARSNFENDTSALVAENGREEPLWVRARKREFVSVTNARSFDFDQDLARFWAFEVHFHNL